MRLFKRRRRSVTASNGRSNAESTSHQSATNQPDIALPTIERPDATQLKYFSICGYMRSGTNWANNLLNLHPHIACRGEYHLDKIRSPFDDWLAKPWCVAKLSERTRAATVHFENFIKQMMLDCALADPTLRNKPIQWIGDRSPKLLESQVIHGAMHFRMMRDVRDVIVSWTYLNFARDDVSQFDGMPGMIEKAKKFQADSDYFFNHPLELLDDRRWVHKVCRQWQARINSDNQFILKTESGEIDARVMSVRYEDLHRNTNSVRRAMYKFLDLDPDLALPLDSGRFKTSAGHDDENPTKLYRKGAVGDWKNYFTPEAEKWVKEFAGGTLVENGWET